MIYSILPKTRRRFITKQSMRIKNQDVFNMCEYIQIYLFIVHIVPKQTETSQKTKITRLLLNPNATSFSYLPPFQFHPYQSTLATQPATFVTTLVHGVQTPPPTWNQYDESLVWPGDSPGGEGILRVESSEVSRVSREAKFECTTMWNTKKHTSHAYYTKNRVHIFRCIHNIYIYTYLHIHTSY